MDPATGIVALTGVAVASLLGLRLKREGFRTLPNETDGYPQSVQESQSRYNQLTNMVNPLKNSIIPVDSEKAYIDSQTKLVKGALGSVTASFPGSENTLTTKYKQGPPPRADDSEKSIFALMKFCREGSKQAQPFSKLDGDGNVPQSEMERRIGEGTVRIFYKTDKDGIKKETGRFDYDEHCGICLTGGVDEEGNPFGEGRRGMVMDADSRETAYSKASAMGLPYPQAKPPVGQCNGTPEEPNFAMNQKDLDRYEKRIYCMKRKQIDPEHQCGVCYENDVYSYIEDSATLNEMSLVLQGVGKAQVLIKGNLVKEVTLDDTKSVTIPLITQSGVSAVEGDSFGVNVSATIPVSNATNTNVAMVYGYFQGINPNGGLFTVPLNMIAITDGISGSAPNRSGGFYTFSELNLEVAKMRPASGKTSMNLKGTLPFTFVSGTEFSAIDCPMAPYQKDIKSVSAFATDQPCFAKGSKPGNYNDDCLRQRILDAGCTNQGTLFKDPKVLNKDATGKLQSLSDIFLRLQDIKYNDMIDPEKTKQCSGRIIESPCDAFAANPDLKFVDILANTTNKPMKKLAEQCLSYLYHNKGANEPGPVQRIGPTYSGIVTYKNNRKVEKNLYCIADGALNPDNSDEALNALANIADTGFRSKIGIDAVKAYLNNQQELAVDMTRNANTDPIRKEAIRNCFGRNLQPLPEEGKKVDPSVMENECGVKARYVRYRVASWAYMNIHVSQVVVFNGKGKIISEGKDTSLSSPGMSPDNLGKHDASMAVNGKTYSRIRNNYITPYNWNAARYVSNEALIIDLGEEYDVAHVSVILPPPRSDYYPYYGWGYLTVDLFEDGNIPGPRTEKSKYERTKYIDYDRNNNSPIFNFDFLVDGADETCKLGVLDSTPQQFFQLPAGYQTGYYINYYEITKENPSITGKGDGWGYRIKPPQITTNYIRFADESTINLYKQWYPWSSDVNSWLAWPRDEKFGIVIDTNLLVKEDDTTFEGWLHTDDGVAVYLNNKLVFSRWDLHAPTSDTFKIQIDKAGFYPLKLVFFQWYGQREFRFLYKLNSDNIYEDWRYDTADRLYYSLKYADESNASYEQDKKLKEAADLARLVAAQQNLSKVRITWYGYESTPQVVIKDKRGVLWYLGPFPLYSYYSAAVSENSGGQWTWYSYLGYGNFNPDTAVFGENGLGQNSGLGIKFL